MSKTKLVSLDDYILSQYPYSGKEYISQIRSGRTEIVARKLFNEWYEIAREHVTNLVYQKAKKAKDCAV